jgi:hypothetical protein
MVLDQLVKGLDIVVVSGCLDQWNVDVKTQAFALALLERRTGEVWIVVNRVEGCVERVGDRVEDLLSAVATNFFSEEPNMKAVIRKSLPFVLIALRYCLTYHHLVRILVKVNVKNGDPLGATVGIGLKIRLVDEPLGGNGKIVEVAVSTTDIRLRMMTRRTHQGVESWGVLASCRASFNTLFILVCCAN